MEKKRVLVVDDSELTLDHVRSTLEAEGYSVSTLDNALEMARVIREETPDVIVLDVKMPLMAGDKMVGVLKKYRFSREIPIVLYSALPPEELASVAAASAASAALTKTDDHLELVRSIERILTERERPG